jgi:hypothetical protein
MIIYRIFNIARKIDWCIKKNNLEKPGKNYWQLINLKKK